MRDAALGRRGVFENDQANAAKPKALSIYPRGLGRLYAYALCSAIHDDTWS
jgi:hypothetical protein